MDKPIKTVTTLIEHNQQDLHFILSKVKMLAQLNGRLMTYLDPSIAKYCQVANFTKQKLTLISANASIATQLRFLTPDLLKQFKQDALLKHVNKIECIVRPTFIDMRLQSQSHHLPPLSVKTAGMIHEIAESIKDVNLRNIMERIANRGLQTLNSKEE